MTKLKPVPVADIQEANEEAGVILARLMSRMAPGEHVLRLGVAVDDESLKATLPVTVEGRGDADDLVGADPVYQNNFRFLLMIALAQRFAVGVMYLRSPAPTGDPAPYMVSAWELDHCAVTSCKAARAADLLGGGESGAAFRDAFSLDDADDDGSESIYPRAAYTVL
ncbi:hypothetical protein [Streptomyces sp. NPDC059271]|uniref:hypothetical protein n=1 Tax=Streptomyces sp. NPDC059271 TaxID=3346799 RepID=UPI0036D1ED2D